MIRKISYLFFALVLLCSCSGMKEVTYFNTAQDADIESKIEALEPVIQKSDLLSITISSASPEVADIFNKPAATATQVPGYLVEQNGNIQLPVLGALNVAGITKTALKQLLEKTFREKKLLVDPLVEVRYLNFKITVLGEVARPSVYTVQNEKITLLEALGMAGDLTIQAKRSNVMVIREKEGVKTIKRLNLNSSELLTSPYYYLRSNDVVYVEPNKSKVYSSGQTVQILPLAISILTLGLLAADRIK